jgi:hypothetical protein
MRIKKIAILLGAMTALEFAARECVNRVSALSCTIDSDERFNKRMPDLPIKQTYTPKINSKSKRW